MTEYDSTVLNWRVTREIGEFRFWNWPSQGLRPVNEEKTAGKKSTNKIFFKRFLLICVCEIIKKTSLFCELVKVKKCELFSISRRLSEYEKQFRTKYVVYWTISKKKKRLNFNARPLAGRYLKKRPIITFQICFFFPY